MSSGTQTGGGGGVKWVKKVSKEHCRHQRAKALARAALTSKALTKADEITQINSSR